jgi:hypothetical protein
MKRKTEYTQMTTRELAEATKEFDVESPRAPGKPLTPAQRARFEAARKGGRPSIDQVLQPIRDAFDASGMTEDELVDLLVKAKKEMRKDRHNRKPQ